MENLFLSINEKYPTEINSDVCLVQMKIKLVGKTVV